MMTNEDVRGVAEATVVPRIREETATRLAAMRIQRDDLADEINTLADRLRSLRESQAEVSRTLRDLERLHRALAEE